MARHQFVQPSHSISVRLCLGLYEFLASLKFAVVLITTLAVVLGLGTFVESAYGTEAVKFGVWNTWWFTLLNALLAVSIFCAAAIRYPWKRYQTGFVITHIGLLTLLAGCFISQRGGIDAQMPLLEGSEGSRAFEDSHHFTLRIESSKPSVKSSIVGPIPFRAGPFNWSEYAGSHANLPGESQGTLFKTGTATAEKPGSLTRASIPWSLAPRDKGVIYQQDGILLEVLDYLSDSSAALAPSVSLRIGSDDFEGAGARGAWIPVDLTWQPDPLRGSGGIRHRATAGGGTVVFWKISSKPETDAFVLATPEPSLGFGEKGQLVLVANGNVFRLLVEDSIGKRVPLGDSGMHAQVTDFQSQLGAVRTQIFRGDSKSPEEMVLVADLPEVSVHAPQAGVYGALWIDRSVASAAEAMEGKARSRIDVVQGYDRKLYYRCWQTPRVRSGELPSDGTSVGAFEMPRAKLQMQVERFLPADRLEVVTLPRNFEKDKASSAKRRAAKVRLIVDGTSEDFWIAGIPIQPVMEEPSSAEIHTVRSASRAITLTMEPDEIDIGFLVRLDNFERRLDPGTSQASHFSSVVEFLGPNKKPLVARPVTITMNAPIDFSDPASGRSYRLFQESFMGPWVPGDELFERFTRNQQNPPNKIEASVLTVNYDPGRGIKYAGSALIVVGIFTMFYMKAYFFGQHKKPGMKTPTHSPTHVEQRLLPT